MRRPAQGVQARDWLDRHRRMVAWNNAVIINTAAGYRAFLAKFPDSDLAATARKLEERLRNRPDFARRPLRGRRRRTAKRRADLSLQRRRRQPPQLKKVDAPVKRVDPDPPKRVDRAPPRRCACPTTMSWSFAVRRRAKSMNRRPDLRSGSASASAVVVMAEAATAAVRRAGRRGGY